jgi:hypothetical protein
MSTTDQGAASGPLPTIDVLELARFLRNALANPEGKGGSYTDDFTGRKTDLSLVPGGPVAASRVMLNSDVHSVLGWAIAETTGNTPASIRLWDGRGITGEQFGRINLQGNESVRDWFIPHGIRCYSGAIFLQVVTGSVEGVVYWQ